MVTHYEWTPVIIAHASFAATALALGTWVLLRAKGTRSHRIAGWTWVILMASVAGSSFFIFRDRYSWIHGLSVYTLAALVVGVRRARRHEVRRHRSTMISLFAGALVVAGAFTLLPGRLLGHTLWSWLP
ncbi:MAG: DUF2306 domain-containing protein [Betaproteobacteria bacterium]